MEIISGRSPVDYARAPGEVGSSSGWILKQAYVVCTMCFLALISVGAFQVNLVEWLKNMVSNRDYEAVLDPKLPEKPTSKALKKALLVALRCVDPDSQKRPKMGHVIHMLEVDDFPYREVSLLVLCISLKSIIFAHLLFRSYYMCMVTNPKLHKMESTQLSGYRDKMLKYLLD